MTIYLKLNYRKVKKLIMNHKLEGYYNIPLDKQANEYIFGLFRLENVSCISII